MAAAVSCKGSVQYYVIKKLPQGPRVPQCFQTSFFMYLFFFSLWLLSSVQQSPKLGTGDLAFVTETLFIKMICQYQIKVGMHLTRQTDVLIYYCVNY